MLRRPPFSKSAALRARGLPFLAAPGPRPANRRPTTTPTPTFASWRHPPSRHEHGAMFSAARNSSLGPRGPGFFASRVPRFAVGNFHQPAPVGSQVVVASNQAMRLVTRIAEQGGIGLQKLPDEVSTDFEPQRITQPAAQS